MSSKRDRLKNACSSSMTVYLSPAEHEAMESLYGAFNMVSDTVTFTQSTLQMLQKSRKEIRDEINNQFDALIEQISAKKMQLIECVSTKYQKKCKKLQTQLLCFKQHRKTIAENKREFESISTDHKRNQFQREQALLHLVNKQTSKLKKSLTSKKIITSTNMYIISPYQIPSASPSQSTLNSNNNMSLQCAIQQCMNLISSTNIISSENKREFGEMYGAKLKCLLLPESRGKTLAATDKKRKKTTTSTKTNSPPTARKSKSKPCCRVKTSAQRESQSKSQYNLCYAARPEIDDRDTVITTDSANKKRRIIRRRSTGDYAACFLNHIAADTGNTVKHRKKPNTVARHQKHHSNEIVQTYKLRLIPHEHPKKKSTKQDMDDDDDDNDRSSTEDSSSQSTPSSSSSVSLHIHCTEQHTEDTAIKTRTTENEQSKSNENLKLLKSYKVDEDAQDTDASSSVIVEDVDHNQEEIKLDDKEILKDELKDMEEEEFEQGADLSISNKLHGKWGELCGFHAKFKSFGIELTNGNKVVHKNHGHLNEDYALLDAESTADSASSSVRCWRFSCSADFIFWGVVYKNDFNKYELKRAWGCCSENAYVKNGVYKYRQIQTEQWRNNLVDMLLDLNEGCLKFVSPNFIEPKFSIKDQERSKRLNEVVRIDGISKTKTWCPIVKLQHVDSMVMAREIDPKWFGKYPKAVKFDTLTHV